MTNGQNAAGLRIALASYDLRQLRVWSHYLEEQSTGLSSHGFRSGGELLVALLQGEHFDVVVLGSQLEDMSAMEFLGRVGRMRERPYFLLMDEGPQDRASVSRNPDGPCYLIRQTSLRDLLEQLQNVPGSPTRPVERICKQYYDRWHIQQPDVNCTYLTQAVCIACGSSIRLAIRKEILQQIAEQRHMTVAAVNSGLRRLIDGLETRQPAAWRSFKEKYHLDEANVTTGKLIYALKRAVEQDL